jgi:TetR/AcrR family transcriptional repressor of lmrAB and yxaGH operons
MIKNDQPKDKIIDVARKLFASRGFEATTTRMINKAAGISEGALYYHFPHGKQEILDTIVQQGIESRVSLLTVSLTNSTTVTDIETQMMTLFDQLWQAFQSETSYQSFIITIRERMLLSDEQSHWLIDAIQQIQARLSQAFQNIEKLALNDSKAADNLAMIVMSIFQKVLYDELLIKNQRRLSADVRERVRQQIHFLLAPIQTTTN